MSEPTPTPSDRVEQALSAAGDPFKALLSLAKQLRDEGMAQDDLCALFDTFRARHAEDADETRLDGILDTMDYIVGFCRPDQALYP